MKSLQFGRQKEIAHIAGVSEALVSYWIRGKRSMPDKACRRLAKHFKVEPGLFRFGTVQEIVKTIQK